MNSQVKYLLIFLMQVLFVTLVIRYITGGYWIPQTKEALLFRLLGCLVQTQFIFMYLKSKNNE